MKQRILVLNVLLMLFVASTAFADKLDDMISPISNPVNFEDPRITSELRPIFAYHEIKDGFVTNGGDVQLYALQARFALTEDLAFIATKDGFIDFNPDATLPQETGFANIAAGFKYAFYQDGNNGDIATFGLRYEAPTGNTDVLQGKGSGQINPFLSFGTMLGEFQFTGGTGFRFPFDDKDSTFYDLDLHLSTELFENFYPTLEFNLVHVLDGGGRLPIKDEGQDLFNFGSIGAAGESIPTGAVGFRYRLCDSADFGIAYQFPLDGGSGSKITDWR
ncbi:MAG: hypothetical protein KDD64_16260, partial [Bdellovibrionales bacterium]|nr:hypothetical protein [Bdellovibrionales bacterium]